VRPRIGHRVIARDDRFETTLTVTEHGRH
jgi:hypothetical protein